MFAGKTASDIFDHIRHLVQSGGLQPGEVLPPVRETRQPAGGESQYRRRRL